ncbi:RNA-binding protein [Companilactobacillus sp. RD055328]|uniref:CvfD/Ygs/GSP13 family RNA-binding post-transcriptional regulator n=1 Tax=Companilactobacillus sp. RD055328 TaxID=2916634 RepID=UPI001FC7F296|nr:CvfD/Ygs/GSP13 family RNA-binding post-transcriptional regulator [Companilactobacillus sp. RD055328]GKQ42078.1 RNA-binding protein [Companilactobacillus sp. RD055328]
MEYRIGDIITGKVAGVQPYGAFVKLDDQTQGLIHISECTNGYVTSVKDILNVGEEVTVKVLDIDEYSKKISLSIRALQSQAVNANNKTHRKRFWTNKGNKIGYKSIADAKPGWVKEALEGLE